MATSKKEFKVKKKKARRKFTDVDVWQKEFGSISVRAVFDVFSTKFKVETHNMKNYSFSDCVNALRKLEDPDYIAPSYSSGV